MNKMQDVKALVEQNLAQDKILVRCGDVIIQAYENRLYGGGVQFNMGYTQGPGADIRVMEATPGYFTIAVVPNGSDTIDYTNRKTFKMGDSLEVMRTAFPEGRNINVIVDNLLAYTANKE